MQKLIFSAFLVFGFSIVCKGAVKQNLDTSIVDGNMENWDLSSIDPAVPESAIIIADYATCMDACQRDCFIGAAPESASPLAQNMEDPLHLAAWPFVLTVIGATAALSSCGDGPSKSYDRPCLVWPVSPFISSCGDGSSGSSDRNNYRPPAGSGPCEAERHEDCRREE